MKMSKKEMYEEELERRIRLLENGEIGRAHV